MRYVTFFTSLCLILTYQLLPAQVPETLWTRTYGGLDSDQGYSIQQTTDGGYIITGYTASFGAGDYDVWLIKTDVSGDTLWTKTFGGSSADRGYCVDTTSDGGYITTGYTYSFGAGSGDIWLIKTDASGDTLWTKTFGGNNSDENGSSVQQTTDGGYVIAGDTGFPGDVWLIKTDASGDTLWTKTFGGNSADGSNSIHQTTDGGYILLGTTLSFGAGDYDIWLIKTNSSGDTLWTKTYGGSDADYGSSIQPTTDGGYIIAGSKLYLSSGTSDVFLIKINSSGDTLRTKTFGGSFDDYGRYAQQTNDSGYIITGATGFPNDVWLIKTDAFGDTLWTKTFGGSFGDIGESVQQTNDGGYIITGSTASFGAGFYDVWLIKVAADITTTDNGSLKTIMQYQLHQNYPNPFNPVTRIRYSLQKASNVQIKVYNTLGEEVAVLLDEQKLAGTYTIDFDGSRMASGVYFYKIEAGKFKEVKKMLLVR